MDYADAVAAFFTPSPPGALAGPTTRTDPARQLRDAIEPIAMHSVWAPAVNAAHAKIGLDFLGGYVWGRAAALGHPTAGVAAATFAVFEPGLVDAVLTQAMAAVGRDELLAERSRATIASLSGILEGIDVTVVAAALRTAATAAEGTGHALFSGLAEMPWPDSPIGVLWRSAELLREHRGDSHVAVCATRGLSPITMNILTELYVGMPLGSYTGTRGWSPEAIGKTADALRDRGLLDGDVLSADGQAFREEIETATDRMEQPHVALIEDDLPVLLPHLQEWSQACIDAGAFPPNVFKRAAG